MLFSTQALAKVDCNKHKIYCKIKELRPKMSNSEAMELSNILYKKAKKYNGDAMLAVAIGMQETGLKERHRKQNIIQFYKECEGDDCQEAWRIVKGITDVCMFQFHVDTIVNHSMDPIRLKNDINYCIDWHFRLINEKKRICKDLGNEAWTCYHSRSRILRNQYKQLVERYL